MFAKNHQYPDIKFQHILILEIYENDIIRRIAYLIEKERSELLSAILQCIHHNRERIKTLITYIYVLEFTESIQYCGTMLGMNIKSSGVNP